MVALFADTFLSSQIAMRGGTLLHKVHLAPACRYSEDIDLVCVWRTLPKIIFVKAIPPGVGEVVGEPERSVWEDIKLGCAKRGETFTSSAHDLCRSIRH